MFDRSQGPAADIDASHSTPHSVILNAGIFIARRRHSGKHFAGKQQG
jgi:hypothetical protein